MTYEPLHHKYRPQTFADLVGQEAIAQTLRNALRTQRIAPAYLFTGPRGTGKTSSARILAKSLNCLKSAEPTEQPCGVCDVCVGITKGSTLDVIEIDAASNTGVESVRELIERAQFAPVQCRHKVYIIDECLTGDSLVLTREGLVRIDDPTLQGKQVLSYNGVSGTWEFKKVVRWLDQGVHPTLVIQTTNREIRCTENHLIRTVQGWKPAKNIKEGVKILSPVNGDAKLSLTNLAQSSVWITNLEKVESVEMGRIERVYDIEVEDNHNFVANGLCLHNCHMLSVAAFNALLKTLEEPPSHVVFVLATTDPQRVLPTIISRCQRFDFRRIPLQAMVDHLTKIAEKEEINISADAVQMVAQVAQGGLRDAESLLDQLSLLSGQVSVEKVWDLVGAVPERDLMALLEAIAADNPEAVIDQARHLMDRGREPLVVLQNLAGFYRDLLIAQTAPNRSDLVAVTAPTWTQLCEFKRLDLPSILRGQQCLKESEVQIRNTTQPRLWLEVTLLGLLPSAVQTQTETSGVQKGAFAPPNLPPKTQPSFTSPPSPPAVSSNAATTNNGSRKLNPAEQTSKTPPPADQPGNSAPSSAIDQPAEQSEVEQVWQQVLAHLPIPSKALFTQHGRLLAINGQQVQVGIRSSNLYKIAESKLPDLETAFLKAFRQKMKVKLEVASTNPSKSSTQETRSSSQVSPPSPSPEVREEVINYQVIDQTQSTSSNGRSHTRIETSNGHSTAEQQTAPPAEQPTQVQPPPAVEMPSDEIDEVMIAAKRLAEFFHGEIVQLRDEAEEVNSPSPSEPVTTQYIPPQETINSVTGFPPDDDDDDDIPF